MALGEAVVGEGAHLLPDPLPHLRAGVRGPRRTGADAVQFAHAREEPLLQPRHPFRGPLGPHRPAQLVGLRAGETGDHRGDLHELLLKQGDPQRPPQHGLERRVVEHHLLPAVAPTDVGVDGTTLDGTRTDEGDLHHEVVERPGSQPRQGGHLGA